MSSHEPRTLEGRRRAPDTARFALVASRFNDSVVERLVEGAVGCLVKHGVSVDRIDLVHVPGAFELPWACRRLAASGKVAAVIALGAVIRGGTPHFEYVAGEATRGIGDAMRETGVPIAFGILTTDTVEQALERARSVGPDGPEASSEGPKRPVVNKGWDAALVALEMVDLGGALAGAGY